MSIELRFTCNATIPGLDQVCGRRIAVTVGPAHDIDARHIAAQLLARGWVGRPGVGGHRCDHHSGVPPIPARVPSRPADVPPQPVPGTRPVVNLSDRRSTRST